MTNPLQHLWSDISASLRLQYHLREWLGINVESERISKVQRELTSRIDKINQLGNEAKLEATALVGEEGNARSIQIAIAVQSLQLQIDELSNKGVPDAKQENTPSNPIMAGHTRFTDRKRQYEISKRKPLETETGKQIAENTRLIASGTRKTDSTT